MFIYNHMDKHYFPYNCFIESQLIQGACILMMHIQEFDPNVLVEMSMQRFKEFKEITKVDSWMNKVK